MISRAGMTQAVNLAIALERGYYLGTVARDKAARLAAIKAHMDNQQLTEFEQRIVA